MESSVTSDITWKCRTNNKYIRRNQGGTAEAGTGFKPVTEGTSR